mgnify:CR=1 FL=1
MRASFIESFNLCSLLLSRFPSPHARSSCSSSSSSSSSSSDVLLARRVFFHPPSGVCVCVLSITARALERVKMRLKIIQTDDEIVRLVNVYFETVWDTPVQFQIERFFRFFVFLSVFLSVSVRALWHSENSRLWNTTERERERERERNKKYKLPFFHSFLF